MPHKNAARCKETGGEKIKLHMSCTNSVLAPKQPQTAQMSRCISPTDFNGTQFDSGLTYPCT